MKPKVAASIAVGGTDGRGTRVHVGGAPEAPPGAAASPAGGFGRRARPDGQGVDVGGHHLAHGGVVRPMAGHRPQPGKGVADDVDG